MQWTQIYDPFGHWWLSTLVAALPIIILFGLLAGLKVKPHWCAIAGASTAVIVAIIFFKMPPALAAVSFGYGVAFGVLKIAWIVLAAVYLYDISVETGQFEIMKESVAGITADRRLQVLLVAFCFGAFIEGAAGFGAPVAIAGAFMIGLGFKPFHAAALNLIANTAPVAWGAIGTPIHTLAAVTALPESDLNAMVGRILPYHRRSRSFLAGENHGELEGHVRSASRHPGGRHLVRADPVFLVELCGRQSGGHHGRRSFDYCGPDFSAILEAPKGSGDSIMTTRRPFLIRRPR